jgi:hypothetical protein
VTKTADATKQHPPSLATTGSRDAVESAIERAKGDSTNWDDEITDRVPTWDDAARSRKHAAICPQRSGRVAQR